MMGQAFALGIKFIKFQLFKEEQVPEAVRDMVITEDLARELAETGRTYGQEVFFSVFYPEAVDICERIGVNYYKVRFKDRHNTEILNKILQTKKTTFYSTSDPIYLVDHLIPLLCVPNYPAHFSDYRGFITHGYSDHTPDFKLYKYARFNKASWFEMHVCMDRETAYEGKWSKSFEELKEVLDYEKINKTIN